MKNKVDSSLIFIVVTIILIIGFIVGAIMLISDKNTNTSTSETKQTPVSQATPTATTRPNISLVIDPNLKLTDRTVIMETNFGTLNIDILDKAAPKASENFIRLTANKYYDGLIFHRMVERPGFTIIQGGDPLGNGTGGESIFGEGFETEVFKKGTTEFIDASLYPNFNGQNATFKKGYIAMAHSSLPNSNGSQFFIMLDDTVLPADYTIFGKIKESDFAVLDKIASEVSPATGVDAKPNKEIKIITTKLAE